MQTARLILKATVCGLLFSAAQAQEKHCSLIDEHRARLACYTEKPGVKSQGWLVAQSNYFASVTVSRSAIHPVMCGDTAGSITIVMVCAEEITKLNLSTSCAMGNTNETRTVVAQVDDQEPYDLQFTIANNKSVLSLVGSDSAIEFTQSLLGHELLHIKVSPPHHASFTASFDLSGLTQKINPLRAACNW